MNQQVISFLIHWLPTLIFLGMLGIGILFGLWRGMRKSIILAIQAGVLFIILLIVYLSIAGAASTDTGLFDLVSQIAGKGTIQNALGVSESCQSFKECFIEFIPKQMPENEGLALIIQDNGQYLATLAEMAVRIVVASVLGIVYILGIFILYLVYLIFYPQRRYEKNLEKDYYQNTKNKELQEKRRKKKEEKKRKKEEAKASIVNNETIEDPGINLDALNDEIHSDEEINDEEIDKDALNDIDFNEISLEDDEEKEKKEEEPEEPISSDEEEKEEPHKPFVYKKRRLFGALIGGVRALISGLIFLSFVGGFFYILAGGPGDDVTPVELDWQDNTYNLAYGAYKDIETYGSTGIFKVLNAFKGTDNAPLYLFAADLVYQGGLKDEAQNVNENVYFRKEISSYTKFARDTFNLLLSYGGEEIRDAILKSKTEQVDMMDTIISVMLKDGFQRDFNLLIDNFEETTYFLNLSFSLISSFVNHMDKLNLEESMGTDTISLIQLLFKKGYLADQIPYEKYVKDNNLQNELESYYISPDLVISKDNTKTIMNMLFGFLSVQHAKEEDQVKMVLDIIENIMPYITDFSFFQEENSDNVSMVLARLYQFVQNTYFKQAAEATLASYYTSTTPVENPYKSSKYANVKWVSELKSLVNSLEDILVLYNHAYKQDNSILDNIFNIFNTNRVDYQEDIIKYEDIKNNVGNSFLLGDILGSEYGTKLIETGFREMLPNLELPKIHYANVMNSDGTVKEYGEFYHLLCALQSFGENQDNLNLIRDLQNGFTADKDSIFDLIDRLADSLFMKDSNDKSVINHVLSSTIFTAVFSEFLLSSNSNESFSLYIDESLLVTLDGNVTRIIESKDLYTFFEKIKGLISVLRNISDDSNMNELVDSILCEEVYNTLDSLIIEGTLSKLLVDHISGDFVKLPKELRDGTGYISKDGNKSELKNLIGLFQVASFKISNLLDDSSEQLNSIIDMLKGITKEDYNKILESKIVYYSLSNYLLTHKDGFLGDADLIIPNITKDNLPDEIDIHEAIKKVEIIDFLTKACTILPEDMNSIDMGSLVNSIVDDSSITDNIILSATITNMMVNVDAIHNSIDGIIIIPSSYKAEAEKSKLDNYTKDNIWYPEQKRLMRSIGALLADVKDSSSNRVTITDPNISDYIFDSFKNLNEDYEDSTKLTAAYESQIMQATISKRIDDLDFLSNEKKVCLKNDTIYKEEELSSLVDLINLFDLDLKNTNILSSAMNQETVLKLLNPYRDKYNVIHDYTNLHHQYENKITGLILTEGIEDATTIPQDAYVAGELYITEVEAEALIECLSPSKLNLNLNNFQFDGNSIRVSTLKKCMYKRNGDSFVLDEEDNPTLISKILLQKFSDQLVTYDYLDVPMQDYDTTVQRINSTSAYYFLSSIESLDPNFNLGQTINDVVLPDPNNDELMKPIRLSTIFRASVSKNVVITVDSAKMDPVVSIDYATKTRNYNDTKDVTILTADETINTFKAIEKINSTTLSDINLSLETIRAYDTTTRNIVLASNLISARISEKILAQEAPKDYTTLTTIRGTYRPIENVEAINIQSSTSIPNYKLLDAGQIEDYIDATTPTHEISSIEVLGADMVTAGSTKTYTVKVNPIDTLGNKNVTWSIVSGNSLATIDASTGQLTANATGTIIIRATSKDSNYSDVYGELEIQIV
ncbi:MAG: Ig-like domain-containing protein [Anaeroplasma sp.]|uniref:Ig-like domain-containing protein n=1 Tax=Anaeroplasma sp. TaxID=1872523 RepID=UPI002A914537|nr:Ig-like domain-containing protein [Anaeroplasma sp.]MDY5982505.1 Ig-like domain-containing protein [Anaeroplasma sp.]